MLEAFGLSDLGCVRKNNEDYCLLAEELGLFIVADGMGGARAGEHASKLAAETVAEYIYRSGKRDAETLVKAFEEANRAVKDAAASDSGMEGMGTTLVAVLEAGEDILIASVGDSRAYVFQDKELIPVTEDQTWVNEVGRRLGIDEESLKTHPLRHVLTMAIGVSTPLRIHSYKLRLGSDSTILLCSDGLHGVVDLKTIEDVIKSPRSFEEKCHLLIDAAKQAGGPDNITVVLLRPTSPN
ncbi:MAG: Stp1/IreP family PP2C-type Ser/Thr phosphatase [Bryobacteraceae bacterium]|nr:Stp1/IreP family PP2C-type Ser/Thr phosphatase [Bryobacteraceae bacterium]MDW8380077.1 Stp1/IreP family PP2C-type Ser/Thr phosphatase [Bryobacterales bacterium]